eukprot:scaffold13609_cov72-Phaeocystis_antarctica.AAC.1
MARAARAATSAAAPSTSCRSSYTASSSNPGTQYCIYAACSSWHCHRTAAAAAAAAAARAAPGAATAAGPAPQRTWSLCCRLPKRSAVQSRAPPTPPHSSRLRTSTSNSPRTCQSCPGYTLRRAPLPTASSKCMARRR